MNENWILVELTEILIVAVLNNLIKNFRGSKAMLSIVSELLGLKVTQLMYHII